jgi:hypothetical protein
VITASIRSYLDRQLEVTVGEDHGYELRYGDSVLATLEDPAYVAAVECVTRDGSWVFERFRGGHCEARDGTAVVARYRSGVLPGGRIELPDGLELRLRPPGPGQTWRVRRGLRERVLGITAAKGPWRIEFASAARELYHLPLLTTFAFHAMLSESDKPAGPGGADGGTGF